MKRHQTRRRKLVGFFFNSFAVALKDALFVAIDSAIILLIAFNQIAMQNVVPEFMPQGEGLPPRRLVLMIGDAPLPRLGLAIDEGAHAAFQIALFDGDDRALWRDLRRIFECQKLNIDRMAIEAIRPVNCWIIPFRLC